MNTAGTVVKCFATILIGLVASAAEADSFPAQGWAHSAGLVNLQPNGKSVTTDNVLDRMLIQEAFYRWGISWDEARLDVISSLFTKDGVIEITLGSGKPIGRYVGTEAIVKYVKSVLKVQADQRRHAMSNIVIDRMSNNEATTIAYGIVTIAADGLSLGATVIYSADLRKEADGVWRFSKFVIGMDEYAGRKVVLNMGETAPGKYSTLKNQKNECWHRFDA